MKNLLKSFNWKKFLYLNIGVIIASVGVAFFMWPNSLVMGGASGFAILLEIMIPKISNTIFLYIINITLLIVALFVLGKKYFFETLYASLLLPTCNLFFEWLIVRCGWLDSLKNLDNWIIVICAAITMGGGIGVALKAGGSTGGFDIVQSICFKCFHMQYSTSNYIINGIIIFIGAFFNGFASALAAIIYLFLSGFVTDAITFGGFNKRAVYIQTKEIDKVSDYIMNHIVRGLSLIDMEGAYTKEKRKMLLCICYTREYLELRNEVSKIDPQAFIFVTRAMEVRGPGFGDESYVRTEVLKKKRNK